MGFMGVQKTCIIYVYGWNRVEPRMSSTRNGAMYTYNIRNTSIYIIIILLRRRAIYVWYYVSRVKNGWCTFNVFHARANVIFSRAYTIDSLLRGYADNITIMYTRNIICTLRYYYNCLARLYTRDIALCVLIVNGVVCGFAVTKTTRTTSSSSNA